MSDAGIVVRTHKLQGVHGQQYFCDEIDVAGAAPHVVTLCALVTHPHIKIWITKTRCNQQRPESIMWCWVRMGIYTMDVSLLQSSHREQGERLGLRVVGEVWQWPRSVAQMILIQVACPMHYANAQISSAVLQHDGSIPRTLVLQFLLHLSGATSHTSPLARENSAERTHGRECADLLSLLGQPKRSQTVQRGVAALLDQAMLAIPMPAPVKTSVPSDFSVTHQGYAIDAEMISCWDMNNLQPENVPAKGFNLQLEAAAIALLELVPSSVPHMTKSVRNTFHVSRWLV